MKRTCYLLATLALTVAAMHPLHAQKHSEPSADDLSKEFEEYAMFEQEFYVGVGGGVVHAFFPSNGMLVGASFNYRTSARFSLAFRTDFYIGTVFGPSDKTNGIYYEPTLRLSASFNGKYFLTTTRFKPYVGAGVGIYGPQGAYYRKTGEKTGMFNGGSAVTDKAFLPGIYPQVGFEFAQFEVVADYHLITRSNITAPNLHGTVNNNLFCLRLYFLIGRQVESLTPRGYRRLND